MRINKNMDIRTFARFHPQPKFIEIELHDKFGLRLHADRTGLVLFQTPNF
jgi:hypothetical protein